MNWTKTIMKRERSTKSQTAATSSPVAVTFFVLDVGNHSLQEAAQTLKKFPVTFSNRGRRCCFAQNPTSALPERPLFLTAIWLLVKYRRLISAIASPEAVYKLWQRLPVMIHPMYYVYVCMRYEYIYNPYTQI